MFPEGKIAATDPVMPVPRGEETIQCGLLSLKNVFVAIHCSAYVIIKERGYSIYSKQSIGMCAVATIPSQSAIAKYKVFKRPTLQSSEAHDLTIEPKGSQENNNNTASLH